MKLGKSKGWVLTFILISASLRLCGAQQPFAQSGQPIYPVNAKYVQGVGPGYWPTAGSGLSLNISSGSIVCGGTVPTTYPGGSLTMTASTTNYVQLNSSASCSPYSNTTGFINGNSPIAVVVAGASAITSVTDWRPFGVWGGGGGGGSTISYPSLGIVTSTGSAWGSAATSATIIGLFGSGACSGYLKSDGTCSTPTLAQTIAGVSHEWLNSYTASTGVFTQTQPSSADLSDISTLNAPTASALAGAPTQCINQFSTGIQASGNANCASERGVYGPFPLRDCVPDVTGLVFYTVANLTHWNQGGWQWAYSGFTGTPTLTCVVTFPHVLPVGTAKIVLQNLASSDATSGHTMTFKTCDGLISSTVNISAPSCASTQNFTTTSTGYAPSTLTFLVNSTATADAEMVVQIIATAQSSLAANVQLGTVFLEFQ